MSIKVFVADDHNSITDGIQSYCTNSTDFEFSGRAETVDKLDHILAQKADKIDVLLLDTFGPEREFLQLVKRLSATYSQLPMLILTNNDSISFAKKLTDGGANGFLNKMLGIREIFESIREAHNYPNRKILRLPRSEPNDLEREEVKDLISARELQVIALLCRGFKNNAEIADLLSSINPGDIIVPMTVQTHRRNIRKKLRDYGVTNDTSLGYQVAKWDLLDGSELSSINGDEE